MESFSQVSNAGGDSQEQTPTEFDSTLAPSTAATSTVVPSCFGDLRRELDPAPATVADPVPDILQQRCASGKWYVLFDKEHRQEFFSWWNSTAAKKEAAGHRGSDPRFGNGSRTAYGWALMDECAQRETGSPALMCTLCGMLLAHPTYKGGGTNGMRTHLASNGCKTAALLKRGREPSISDMVCIHDLQGGGRRVTVFGNGANVIQFASAPKLARTDGHVPAVVPYSKATLEDFVLKMCISMNLPFNMADNGDFRNLVTMLRPEAAYDLPHRTKLRELLRVQCGATTKRLFNEYVTGSKVSWAVDVWTSPDMKAFMGINCYFINAKWEFREVLAGFEPISGKHDGATLARAFYSVMGSYEAVKLAECTLAVTADNASNNNTMREKLKQTIARQHGGHEWDHKLGSIPCLAHVIQLAVNELVKGLAIESDNEDTVPRFGDDHLPDPNQSTGNGAITFQSTLQKVTVFGNAHKDIADIFHFADSQPCQRHPSLSPAS